MKIRVIREIRAFKINQQLIQQLYYCLHASIRFAFLGFLVGLANNSTAAEGEPDGGV